MLNIFNRAKLLLASISLVAVALAEEPAEEIYVEVEDGVPSFSDRSSDESQRVDIQPPVTFESENLVPKFRVREEEAQPPEPVDYTLEITNPPDDSAIRENSGALTLSVTVSPSPASGHQAELLMDGQVIRTLADSGEVSLSNVDRGTHQFQIRVVDESGREVASGPVTRISMLRYFRPPGN